MKKKILAVVLAVTMLAAILVPVLSANAADKIKFDIGEITGIAPGAIVDVPVTITNNPGLAAVGVIFNFSSNLTFVDPDDEEEGYDIETLSCPKGKKTINFGATLGDPETGKQSVLLLDNDDEKDITGDGTLVILKFKVASDLKVGDEIKVTVSIKDDVKPTTLAETKPEYEVGEGFSYKMQCASHTWDDGSVTTAPKCGVAGVKTYKCTVPGCTGTRTEEVPALTHYWDEGEITTAPKCETAGEKTFHCIRQDCTGTTTEEVAALGHAWDEGEETKKAECGVPGEKTFKCTREDCTATKTEATPALAHDVKEWKVVKEATVDAEGEKTGFCELCKKDVTEVIPKLAPEKKDVKASADGDNMNAVLYVLVAVMALAGVAFVAKKRFA